MTGPGPGQIPGTEPEDAERVAATIARRLSPSLVPFFDARFTISHALYDEFVFRLTLRVFRDTGLGAAIGEWGTTGEIVTRAGLDPGRATARREGSGVVQPGFRERHLHRARSDRRPPHADDNHRDGGCHCP